MTTTQARQRPSDVARAAFDRSPPLFTAAWSDVVMIHYRVAPERLQPLVPFPLETFEGAAWVSLVAFTLRDLRFARGGPSLTTHGFLNVRTYVPGNGIHFLAEWLPNPLCVFLGPRLYGLPYRRGRLDYRHAPDRLQGRVEGRDGALAYEGRRITPQRDVCVAPRDLFLMERYVAFTRRGRTDRLFRVWHEPWRQSPAEIDVLDDSLVASTGPWFAHAERVSACYSPGFDEVWMGRLEKLA